MDSSGSGSGKGSEEAGQESKSGTNDENKGVFCKVTYEYEIEDETSTSEEERDDDDKGKESDSDDEQVGGGKFPRGDDESGNDPVANSFRKQGALEGLQFKKTINSTFVALEPTDSDLESMAALLKQLFKSFDLDVLEFAKVLVSQNYVTTVLKADIEDEPMDDDDSDNEGEEDMVYGLYGVINLKSRKNNNSVSKLVTILKEKSVVSHADNDTKALFEKALNIDVESNINTGFLIKEKIVNIPGAANIPSLFQLRNEMETATKKGMNYKFDYFIHLSKVVILDQESKSRMKTNNADYYVDEEDELLRQDLTVHFDINPPKTSDDKIVFASSTGKSLSGKSALRVFLIPDIAFNTWLDKLKEEEMLKPIMAEACASGLVM